MTDRRDMFAAAALAGHIASGAALALSGTMSDDDAIAMTIRASWEYADAMLAADPRKDDDMPGEQP